MTHGGASFIGVLSRSNAFTHLVCWKFEGWKYELAKKFKIIIVNQQWIEDCIKQRKRVPKHPYTFQRGNYGHSEIHRKRQLMPRGIAAVNGPTDWNEALEIISSEDLYQMTFYLKSEELDMAVNQAREFMKTWSPKSSKLALRSEPLSIKIQSSTQDLLYIKLIIAVISSASAMYAGNQAFEA